MNVSKDHQRAVQAEEVFCSGWAVALPTCVHPTLSTPLRRQVPVSEKETSTGML